MEKLYDEMVFAEDNYDSNLEMWKDIAITTRTLLQNEYQVLVREDEVGIIVLEYNHNTSFTDYGTPEFRWMTVEDAEAFDSMMNAEEAE